jgi:hypothetical protein
MGLRGYLPAIKAKPADRLSDLSPPEWLDELAADYWRKHCKNASDNGLLTVQTAESFALCCYLWSQVRRLSEQGANRVFLDTQKGWQSLARMFRLLPIDKPGLPPTERHDLPVFEAFGGEPQSDD